MGDIVRDLFIIQQRHPELRIGQIISIAAHKGGWEEKDTFYCPDVVLKEGFKNWIAE